MTELFLNKLSLACPDIELIPRVSPTLCLAPDSGRCYAVQHGRHPQGPGHLTEGQTDQPTRKEYLIARDRSSRDSG